jgi:hypothetical protein
VSCSLTGPRPEGWAGLELCLVWQRPWLGNGIGWSTLQETACGAGARCPLPLPPLLTLGDAMVLRGATALGAGGGAGSSK